MVSFCFEAHALQSTDELYGDNYFQLIEVKLSMEKWRLEEGLNSQLFFFHPVSMKYISGHVPETPDILA